MALTIEQIATNRYAPAGADAISLYGTKLADGLTLGQLVIAVSMRSAAEYEAQSVVKMNRMAGGSEKLGKLAAFMAEIAGGDGDWATIKEYCKNELGITDELPDAIDTYAKRMSAISALKAKANALTQQQQTEMIDLQTLVNRRDVAYSASSNIIRALGSSQDSNAANF
ncbi:MAG: hypothetical protein IIT98_02455 [Kiritimatiellae bacterium]|nr:hypothetical protein [Kiritimatiellia bacterium]